MMPTKGEIAFSAAFHDLILVEGRYSDHPSDAGGRTCYGITEAVAREWGYQGAMVDLPLETAQDIYRAKYWSELNLDTVAQLSVLIAFELFDTAVNMGTETAAAFLQECLNAFNQQERRYNDVAMDGDLGNATLEALSSFLAWRKDEGVTVLLRALNCLQGARYIKISRTREENEDFTYGWFLRRIKVRGDD